MMMTNEAQTSAAATDRTSVGGRLRAARVARGLELRDMAAVTKIQSGLLADLEGDRFDEFDEPWATIPMMAAALLFRVMGISD